MLYIYGVVVAECDVHDEWHVVLSVVVSAFVSVFALFVCVVSICVFEESVLCLSSVLVVLVV